MNVIAQEEQLLDYIVDRANIGLFVLNPGMEIMLWNKFMEAYSGHLAKDVVGKNLFDCFPELPRRWLEKKINSVFLLKNFAFTSWEQRPYLFQFPHNRPITGGIDYMRQNCTFLPVKGEGGEVPYVCVSILDVTDTAIYQIRLQEALAALEESNNRDGLTGVFNRRYIEARLGMEFERVKRYGDPLSVLLFDLDHFKKVNDVYGHLAGDQVLRVTADRINEAVRNTDVMGRYGGEEFMVVLPGTNLLGAQILGDRLCAVISEKPIIYKDTVIPVTISIGASAVREEVATYEALIQEADTALYKSKEGGRNRITCFTPEN